VRACSQYAEFALGRSGARWRVWLQETKIPGATAVKIGLPGFAHGTSESDAACRFGVVAKNQRLDVVDRERCRVRRRSRFVLLALSAGLLRERVKWVPVGLRSHPPWLV
jgi:hypothetical protein